MNLSDIPVSLNVSMESLIRLSIECWRLRQWLNRSEGDSSALAVRHVARQFEEFLNGNEIEVMDLTGQPYEAGLAVEVLDTVKDESSHRDYAVIVETVSPVVVWHGMVVKFGQVVIGRTA